MKLLIAEKPSVGRAIASVLGSGQKGDGCIVCGDTTVTWLAGHVLEQADPDEYTPDDIPKTPKGNKVWRDDELPIIPKTWKKNVTSRSKAQFGVVAKLLKKATTVIHAGDPDREGELLVQEVLDYCGYSGKVMRFWVSSQDATNIKRGLDNLQEISKTINYGRAAEARSRADWLFGMNFTRAYTLASRRAGGGSLISVGRVQTPTLRLIVDRDRQIDAFVPKPYVTLAGEFEHTAGKFTARWVPAEGATGLDEEGRLVDVAVADAIVAKLAGASGKVAEYKKEAKERSQPLVYSLSALTKECSAKFGMGAKQVLDTCQSLYETHKLTTYPRSDCGYLPEAQFADAAAVVEAIKATDPELVLPAGFDIKIKSKVWNDKKVGDGHHATIPTLTKGRIADLSDVERKVYGQIVRAYLAQFMPACEYLATSVLVDCDGNSFTASGKTITKPGWLELYGKDADDEDDSESGGSVPLMATGDALKCLVVTRKDAMTKPPARFTEGTLYEAMCSIHKFVQEEFKSVLKETDGIGTEATRANIIETIKDRGYAVVKGKNIISSDLGRSVIDMLPELLKSPMLSALNERFLKGIERGEKPIDEFVTAQADQVRKLIDKIKGTDIALTGAASAKPKGAPPTATDHKCSSCGKPLVIRSGTSKKGAWKAFACTGYPACNAPMLAMNDDGTPGQAWGKK